jgi:hypothetical protein
VSGERRPIGWGRAIASGVVILVVAVVVTVGGANLILTRANGLSRDNRQYLAAFYFLVTVAVIAWALRRLQSRNAI